jgi:small subunit ribosomal protein S12
MSFSQLIKNPRSKKKHTNNLQLLMKCPQKKGVCVKVRIASPKKPNSAKRKIVKIKLTSTKRNILAYIPGQGHSLKSYSIALVAGGRANDLPGVRVSLLRGWRKGDFKAEDSFNRQQKRSKYGKKNKEGY